MNGLFSRFAWRSVIGACMAVAVAGAATPASAASEGIAIPRQDWTFGGLTGYFDKQQLRRGFMVYKNVCASCHGISRVYFRNLTEPGGPQFNVQNAQTFASEALINDGPNDDGEMFERAGKLSDRFPPPYPNAKAAAAAQGGSVPPDLSLITKARTVATAAPWYLEPFHWMYDIATAYQEQGADYLYALLTGYHEAPEGVNVLDGMHYNAAFPGHQIAMPAPLSADLVEYTDGTPATVDNYARDVTAFLMWTAEPKLMERKSMGLQVMLYLAILSVLLYLSKRALWRNEPH